MWNLRNKTNQEITKTKERETDRQTNQETLLTIENKLVVTRGEMDGGMGKISEKD